MLIIEISNGATNQTLLALLSGAGRDDLCFWLKYIRRKMAANTVAIPKTLAIDKLWRYSKQDSRIDRALIDKEIKC